MAFSDLSVSVPPRCLIISRRTVSRMKICFPELLSLSPYCCMNSCNSLWFINVELSIRILS